jgi:hypothetical protein
MRFSQANDRLANERLGKRALWQSSRWAFSTAPRRGTSIELIHRPSKEALDVGGQARKRFAHTPASGATVIFEKSNLTCLFVVLADSQADIR